MEIFGEIFAAVVISLIALKPGPLRLRGAFSRRGPGHVVEGLNAAIIRVVAFVIAAIILIDVVRAATGRPRILH